MGWHFVIPKGSDRARVKAVSAVSDPGPQRHFDGGRCSRGRNVPTRHWHTCKEAGGVGYRALAALYTLRLSRFPVGPPRNAGQTERLACILLVPAQAASNAGIVACRRLKVPWVAWFALQSFARGLVVDRARARRTWDAERARLLAKGELAGRAGHAVVLFVVLVPVGVRVEGEGRHNHRHQLELAGVGGRWQGRARQLEPPAVGAAAWPARVVCEAQLAVVARRRADHAVLLLVEVADASFPAIS